MSKVSSLAYSQISWGSLACVYSAVSGKCSYHKNYNYITLIIITVGHRSFTEQSVHMTVHTATWSDKMTGSSRSS